ncbi:MAG TPA: hypothetical protein VHY22_02980 [Chthoniobacteraceae bacterium]|jgi:uncharacterized protein (TIGR02598 family)|nr:hypothetical protein [Chthoniobacteraceae bacterium]
MKSPCQHRRGFSLIEVTLALGVASFCLVPLLALLPLGMNSNRNASAQTVAAGIATAISADMQASPVLSGTTSRFAIPLKNGSDSLFFGDDGSVVGEGGMAPAGAKYRATLSISQDASDSKLLNVWVLVTWPAMADPSAAVAPRNFSGSYELPTAVNCF